MDNQKIIETNRKNKYLISVSEEYFYQKYPNWENLTGPERMEIRNSFISEIEKFLLGIASKGIAEFRFIDQHLNLKNAVSIAPLAETVL